MSLTASVPPTAIPQYLGYLSKTVFIVPIRRDQLERTGHFVQLDLLADPDEPRDLFGMVNRVKGVA